MPIVQSSIKQEINSLIDTLQSGDPVEKSPDTSREEFVDGLTNIIVNAIQSATITIPSGLIITAGTAASQSNAAPIIINNGVS